MKRSLKERIYQWLLYNHGWINGAEFEKLAFQAGYKPSNASRRLRELYQEGKLERRLEGKSKSVAYKIRVR